MIHRLRHTHPHRPLRSLLLRASSSSSSGGGGGGSTQPEVRSPLPDEVVEQLDKFIVGQSEAKTAVAIALRDRWRRRQLPAELQDEVLPNNILLQGPTGVGKTEVARRLAKLAGVPFLKVEATKYSEVGIFGGDTEDMVKELVEVAITQEEARLREELRQAARARAEERVVQLLGGSEEEVERNRQRLRDGTLDKRRRVKIDAKEPSGGDGLPPELAGLFGALGAGPGGGDGGPVSRVFNLQRMPRRPKSKKTLTVPEAVAALEEEELSEEIGGENIPQRAVRAAEERPLVENGA